MEELVFTDFTIIRMCLEQHRDGLYIKLEIDSSTRYLFPNLKLLGLLNIDGTPKSLDISAIKSHLSNK